MLGTLVLMQLVDKTDTFYCGYYQPTRVTSLCETYSLVCTCKFAISITYQDIRWLTQVCPYDMIIPCTVVDNRRAHTILA